MTTMTTMTNDRCSAEGKDKKSFATQAAAEEFEKQNRAQFDHDEQRAYKCPQFDHFHLTSIVTPYVPGAPQVRTTDWSRAKDKWQVTDPEMTRSDLILAALQRHKGTKTAKEIGLECGLSENNLTLVYNISREHNIPYKQLREVSRPVAPAVTLQSVQSQRLRMEEELKRLVELEQDINRKTEEKKRVIVKLAANGGRANETMIWATTFGCGGLWLTVEQANSLIAQLPAVIEEMKSRETGVEG